MIRAPHGGPAIDSRLFRQRCPSHERRSERELIEAALAETAARISGRQARGEAWAFHRPRSIIDQGAEHQQDAIQVSSDAIPKVTKITTGITRITDSPDCATSPSPHSDSTSRDAAASGLLRRTNNASPDDCRIERLRH